MTSLRIITHLAIELHNNPVFSYHRKISYFHVPLSARSNNSCRLKKFFTPILIKKWLKMPQHDNKNCTPLFTKSYIDSLRSGKLVWIHSNAFLWQLTRSLTFSQLFLCLSVCHFLSHYICSVAALFKNIGHSNPFLSSLKIN